MKVLVACEYSGRIRDAFLRRGHDAWSCDLLPTEISGPHYEGPVQDVLDDGWDLMVAHPPCTYLTNSGAHLMKDNPARQALREEAMEFVRELWDAPIPRIAIENPIGHLSTAWRRPDQIIQPFHHGHPEWKSTCLWLKGLPLLKPSKVVAPESKLCGGAKPGRVSSRIYLLPPSPDRWKERSRTFTGIAEAIAEQWGALVGPPPAPWIN